MAKKEVYVWMSQQYLDDYKDPEQCFGRKEGGYDSKAESCTPENCVDLEMCKKLSKGGIPILEGTKPTLAVDNTTEEPLSKDTEWTRETVLATVLEVIKDKGDKPEVVSTATRDKVFMGESDVFIVTKRALKIHRLERGEKLGINKELWKQDNKGIVVSYNSSLDFKAIVKSALDGLYIESLPQKEIPKTKTDLFDTEVESDNEVVKGEVIEDVVEETVEEVEKPVVKVGVDATGDEPVVTEVVEEFIPDELNKGEVTKVLKITSYSNGYNEVSVMSKATVDEILAKIGSILV